MIFGAALISGALVNGFLISLLFEAITRKYPLVFVVVPLVAYGWYYALYMQQANEIARKSDELRASNPGKIFDFDPNSQSLVTAEANSFVTLFAIPVAYAPMTISSRKGICRIV